MAVPADGCAGPPRGAGAGAQPASALTIDLRDGDPSETLLRAGIGGEAVVIGSGSGGPVRARLSPKVSTVIPTFNPGPVTVVVRDGSEAAHGPVLLLDHRRGAAATEFAHHICEVLDVRSVVVAGWTDRRGRTDVARMQETTRSASLLVIGSDPARSLREAAGKRPARDYLRMSGCPVALVPMDGRSEAESPPAH